MLTLSCFGSTSVVDCMHVPISLRSRKHLALLLYITCRAPTRFTRDELAYLLWSDTGTRGRHSLSQALYDLRTALGPVLETTQDCVQSLPGVIACEARDLEVAVDRMDYDEVLSLYRGPMAPDLVDLKAPAFDAWLEKEQDRLDILVRVLLIDRIGAAQTAGDWDTVCHLAWRLHKLGNSEDAVHRAMMRALWMKGDVPSAAGYYNHLVRCRPEGAVDPLSGATNALGMRARRAASLGASSPSCLCTVRHRLVGHVFALLSGERRQGGILLGERGIGKSTIINSLGRLAKTYGYRVVTNRGALKDEPLGGPHNFVIVEDVRSPKEVERALWAKRAFPRTPVVLVLDTVSFRTAYMQRVVEAATAEGFFVHEVPPLDESMLQEVLDTERPEAPRNVKRLAIQYAGGNPLCAIALVDHVLVARQVRFSDASALRLRELLEQQLTSLSDRSRELLETIGVLGRKVPVALIDLVVGESGDVRDALLRLTARRVVTLSNGGDACSVRPRILGAYTRWKLGAIRCSALHRIAAEVACELGEEFRLIAAQQHAAAGQYSEACAQAQMALDTARRRGRLRRVERAAKFVQVHARSDEERAGGRLQEATALAQRGSFHAAEALFLDLLRNGALRSDVERREVPLSLGFVAARRGAIGEAEAWYQECRQLGAGSVVDASFRVRLTALGLRVAAERNRPHEELVQFQVLQEALPAFRPSRVQEWDAWCAAWQLYLPYVLERLSVSAARNALTRNAHNLSRAPSAVGPILQMSRGLVAVRAGHLEQARRDFVLAIKLLRGQTDVSRALSVALNNLGATYLELGLLTRAGKLLKRAAQIDGALKAPTSESAIPLLNLTGHAVYKGSTRSCVALTRRLLSVLERRTHRALYLETVACSALVGLGGGAPLDEEGLQQVLELAAYEPDLGHDRFKITWLQGFLYSLQDPKRALAFLQSRAEAEADSDVIAAAKLSALVEVLARRCSGEGSQKLSHPVNPRLVPWFPGVGSRWWRTAAARAAALDLCKLLPC